MTTEKRPLAIEDFWSLETVGDVQLSPDGATIAYVVGSYEEHKNAIRSTIWLGDLASGESRQFTQGGNASMPWLDSQPRWSPDGTQLAFVSTRHEGKPQVFLISVTGGEPRQLTRAKEGAHSPVWSPKGTHLCYSSEVESERQRVSQEVEWFQTHPEADKSVAHLRRQNTVMYRMDGRGYVERRT